MRKENANYHDVFLRKSTEMHGTKYNYSLLPTKFTYKTIVPIQCYKHGIFMQKARTHVAGSNCQLCMHELKVVTVYNQKRHTKDQFIQKSKQLHGDWYDYSETIYTGQMKRVKVRCPRHGCFEVVANNHVHGTGCNKCKRSRGETLIGNYLQRKHIHHEVQKSFNDLKMPDAREGSPNRLKYDFYLPVYNLLIEFDGKHHFTPCRFQGISQERAILLHQRTKLSDIVKNNYAKAQNIALLRIPYTKLWYIEDVLEKHLIALGK